MSRAIFTFLLLGHASALQPATALQPASMRVQSATIRMRGGATSSDVQGFAAKRWSNYLTSLEVHPMPTKMVTAAVLSGTGDIVAQAIDGATGAFALRRCLTLVSVNVLYVVPILTWFYALNERLAKKLKLRDGWRKTAIQLTFDQFINAPIVIAGFFASFQVATAVAEYMTTGIPTGPSALVHALRGQLKASYVSTVVSNWKVWILPQLINFAVIPPYARVAFANAVNLVWNVILSVIANSS